VTKALVFGGLLCGLALAAPMLQSRCPAQMPLAPVREEERSVRVARTLLTDVVGAQLNQLQDNQLQDTQIYADLEQLQQRLSELSKQQFVAVATLIQAAEKAPARQSGQAWAAVREEVRRIVLQLVIERRKVLDRLQLSHWADDARRLIELQTAAQKLAQQPSPDEAQLLEAIQSQQFVGKLYREFDTALGEAIAWGEPSSRVAEMARRLLRAAETGQHLRAAEQSLRSGNRPSALVEQDNVLRTLRTLLPMLRGATEKADPSLTLALQLLADIRRRQQSLSEATAKIITTAESPEKEAALSQLVARQQQVHEQLGRLLEYVNAWPELAAMAEASRATAFLAIDKLFQQDRSAAAEQEKLQSQLEQLRQALQREFRRQSSDRSADELADEVETLSRTLAQLKTAAAAQEAVAPSLETDLTTARKKQAAIGRQVNQLPQDHRYAAARQRVANAARALRAARLVNDNEARTAVDAASGELQQAVSETAAELADLRRRHKAIEVGELARAAEALERAAAAEGRLAERFVEQRTGVPKQNGALAEEHQKARETVKRVAAGIQKTAPQASQALQTLQPEFAQIAERLLAETAVKAERPAAAEQAQRLQKALTQAAADVRRAGAQSAEELAQLANAQLEPLTQARQQMQQVATAAPRAAMQAAAQAQAALAAAQKARQAHLAAAGNTAAARLARLAEQLGEAQQQHAYVAALAERLAKGQGDSSWSVANEQEKITDLAKALAQNAEESLQPMLAAAAAASTKAAQADLKNDAAAGRVARRRVQELLAAARRQAETMQNAALAAKPEPPGSVEATNAAAALEDSLQNLASAVGQQAAAARGAAKRAAAVDPQAAQALRHIAADATSAEALASNRLLAQAAAQRVSTGVERALASISTREQQVRRDAEIAQRMAQLMRGQQKTRDEIAQQAAILDQPADENHDDANQKSQTQQQQQAAESLDAAMREFAESQVETGEGAVAISGQEDVANQELLAGLRAASQLAGDARSEPDAAMAGESSEGESDGGEPSSPTEPTAENAPANEGGESKSPAGDEPGEMRPASKDADPASAKAGKVDNDADAKFVPSSPEETARQIAGEQAAKVAAAMKGQAGKDAASSKTGEAAEGDNISSLKSGPQQRTERASGDASTGRELQDAPPDDDFTGVSSRDAASNNAKLQRGGKRFAEPAWFAKLPPSLREAIRAKSRSAAPRSYELRLKRYFQSNE